MNLEEKLTQFNILKQEINEFFKLPKPYHNCDIVNMTDHEWSCDDYYGILKYGNGCGQLDYWLRTEEQGFTAFVVGEDDDVSQQWIAIVKNINLVKPL